jgi:hypothetical protein
MKSRNRKESKSSEKSIFRKSNPVKSLAEKLAISPSGYSKCFSRKGQGNRKLQHRPVVEEIR